MATDPDVCQLSRLDEGLFSEIVCKLSLEEILCLRCVCKVWNAVLLKCFLRVVGGTPIYTIHVCTGYPNFREVGFAAYNIEMGSWQRWTSATHSTYCSESKVHGQVGHLLLVEHRSVKEIYEKANVDPCQGLCLINLAKTSRTRLPSLPEASKGIHNQFERDSVVLIAGECPNSFKVLIVMHNWYREPAHLSSRRARRGGQGRGLGTSQSLDAAGRDGVTEESLVHGNKEPFYRGFLYDSVLGSWDIVGTWVEKDDKRIRHKVFHGGSLYCIRDEFYYSGWRADNIDSQVCRYDKKNSFWQELSAPMPTKVTFGLFERRGHLMLAGGEYGRQATEPRYAGIKIWQLDEQELAWVESTRMPNHLLDHFCLPDIDNQDVSMGSHPTVPLVWFQICGHYTWWESMYSDYSIHRHAIFDMSRNRWWMIPEPDLTLGLGPASGRELVPHFESESKPELEQEEESPASYSSLGFSFFTPKMDL